MKSEHQITKAKAYKLEQTKKIAELYQQAKKEGKVKVTTLPLKQIVKF